MHRDQSPGALRRRAYEAKVNKMMTKVLNFGKKLGIKITPGFMDIFCQVMYGVVFSGVVYVGIWDVLTFLYSDFGWLRTTQTIGWFLTLEIVVNWLCIKYVDSSYKPALHGGKPLYESNQSLVSMATNVDGDDVANVNNMNVPHSFSTENKNDTNNASSAKKRKNVFVAVALPNKDGHVKREEFDYWSWTPCVVCRRPRPPRCHHCSLCRKCVLKRDHHCFFAGSCVGVNNQRYFIVFLFWAFLGCVHGLKLL